MENFKKIIKLFPDSKYVIDSKQKIIAINENIAAKNMDIALFYQNNNKYMSAIKRYNVVINDHASSELAVIGSGDVLSGLVVSLVGQKKINPFLAGCAATWLHGDIAKHYEKGLIAEDLVKGIPSALKRLKKWKTY